MDKSKRQVVIAGNWKMNKNAEETKALLGEMTAAIKDADCKVLLCVPAINISTAVEATKNGKIGIIATSGTIKSGAYLCIAFAYFRPRLRYRYRLRSGRAFRASSYFQ